MKLYLIMVEDREYSISYPTNAVKDTEEEAAAICDYMNSKLGDLARSDDYYYVSELDTDDVVFNKEKQAPKLYYRVQANLETKEIKVYDCSLEPMESKRDSVVTYLTWTDDDTYRWERLNTLVVETQAFSKEDAIYKAIDIIDDWLREEKEKAVDKLVNLATDGDATEEDLRKAIDYSKDILDLIKSLKKEG